MKRIINIKAIIAGFTADFFASLIFTILLTILVAVILSAKGFHQSDIETKLVEVASGWPYMFLTMTVGLIFTIMGGYIAGRIAGSGEYFHSAAVGVINVLLGLLFITQYPLLYAIAGILLPIPAALLGGNMARDKNMPDLSGSDKEAEKTGDSE